MQTIETAALQHLGIKTLNPMQEAAHKAILQQAEVLLLSPTGSGKTVAFLLPVLSLFSPTASGVQCLVLVPSRELALQLEQVWKKMSTGYKVNVCYGGHDARTEANNLATPPALLIGTPGRIADHVQRGRVDLTTIPTLILDEFDKSLELGFQQEMEFIIKGMQQVSKKILVSATSAIQIPAFALVKSPEVLNFSAADTKSAAELSLRLIISPEKDKVNTLFQLLCHLPAEPALIFCNHRESCERTASFLQEKGLETAIYHGGLEQTDRERALIRFRNGSVHYLVTTDLAARGLDIPAMNQVIHFQLPPVETDFTHRNGRTARMNAKGTAYLLISQEEKLPKYITEAPTENPLPKRSALPAPPLYQTVYINGGKKNKVNKFDVVGTFLQKGQLDKDDLGLIEVQDYNTYVAVKTAKVSSLLSSLKDEKIKGKKYKIGIAG
jgi:superfamily II DNA/RNA helicase